jgi:tetratricopeptide (TPR) repeat protein
MNRSLNALSGLLAGAILAGCAAVGTGPEPAAAPKAGPAPAALPDVELTPDVLYDLLLGEIAGQRGQLEVAAASLNRAARKTRDPRLVERATLVGLYAKRPQETLETARLWTEIEPDNLEAREALASVLMELGRPDEARQHLERIVDKAAGADLTQAYLRIAAALGRQQNRVAALEIMERLVQRHPDKAEAHFAMAHLAVRVGNLEQADGVIDRALRLRPDWEEAAMFKTRVLISQKDPQKVIAFSEKFLDGHPRATNFRTNYARFLVDLKQWDKARDQFKRVVAIAPRDADALYAVGLLALQTNDLDDAEKYLMRNLEVQPDNDQARLYLGQIAEQRKLYAEAGQWFREIRPGPHHFEAQARLGLVIARQGDVAAARSHLHKLSPENEPQRVQQVLTEEQILREARQYDEALHVLSKTIKQLPENTDLLYARALVAEKLDDLDLHERDLRAILSKEPKNAHALNALGYTLADRTTRYDEALQLIEQALALKPDDPFIMDSMGWVKYRLGNYEEAVKYLRAALEKRPDAEISAHLGEVLWVMGDRAGAESVWMRALRDSPDSEVLLGIIKKFKP